MMAATGRSGNVLAGCLVVASTVLVACGHHEPAATPAPSAPPPTAPVELAADSIEVRDKCLRIAKEYFERRYPHQLDLDRPTQSFHANARMSRDSGAGTRVAEPHPTTMGAYPVGGVGPPGYDSTPSPAMKEWMQHGGPPPPMPTPNLQKVIASRTSAAASGTGYWEFGFRVRSPIVDANGMALSVRGVQVEPDGSYLELPAVALPVLGAHGIMPPSGH